MDRPSTRMITDLDMNRLSTLIAGYNDFEPAAIAALERGLERAIVVRSDAVGRSLVTMNSRFLCRDHNGATRELTIVYPWHAKATEGHISVLAPLGRVLLGAAIGDQVEVVDPRPTGKWLLETMRYQPEAAGDFHL